MINKNYLAIFAKSFNWAGFFLPKKTYEDCAKLYAFCRVLDDIADEESNLDSKIEKFNKIKNFFKNTYDFNNKEIDSLNSFSFNSIEFLSSAILSTTLQKSYKEEHFL